MAKSSKWVYYFGQGKADGDGSQKDLLGGKGAGLAEMTRIGLPVPAGFTITTEACAACSAAGGSWPTGLEKQVRQMLAELERACGKKLGAQRNPLLVSVRSGAARSMPGMMETILNLGLNDSSVAGLAEVSTSWRFALDSYRRFIMMYGSTARGIDRELFDDAFDRAKRNYAAIRLGRSEGEKVLDTELNEDELGRVVNEFKEIYVAHAGEPFPQDPFEQLKGAIDAVFRSWMADKAVTYRRVEKITGLKGTAVNICQMVFGNMGDDCGTGVCFTRDPSTGEAVFYGDMLINAQGEDVVAGIRTPLRLQELSTRMPEVYEQLEAVRVMLELHYKDMQDLEFTIERGTLYMLQCRTGKRSPSAAFKIAVDQATAGLMSAAEAQELVKKRFLPARYAKAASRPILTKDEAIARIQGEDIERLFYPVLSADVPLHELQARRLGEGTGAVPGAACGQVVFSAEEAETRAQDGTRVILVRRETSPEDVGGMHAAVGVLTASGGKTSHAAVVARGWGKCCIVGCDDLNIDYKNRMMRLGGHELHEGDLITLDGASGVIYQGEIPTDRPMAPPEYDTLMSWCDKRRRMRVRTNADTPEDAIRALEFGAEGIGLCRTEHMFFDADEPQRMRAMREMILADSETSRRRALDKLLPFQIEDFEGIYTAMDGKPVTVRLLDPPLHEFLPQDDNPDGQQAVVDDLQGTAGGDGRESRWQSDGSAVAVAEQSVKTVTLEDVQRRVEQLEENNPMLGHRGCRLCITYPEILEMQVHAIIEAAIRCTERGIKVLPEIMIPLSIDAKEIRILAERTRAVADALLAERNCNLHYLVGTMVETPRAALTAGRMAEEAEFFSFGTNDLTQMTLALSRDDAGRFLPDYVDQDKAGILPCHPFQSIDTDGVGMLLRIACENGRATRKELKIGICGEHGGDPASVHFCEELGLDYVSCSPYRVPIARLAAAQAVIAGPAGQARARSAARPKSTQPARAAKKPADSAARPATAKAKKITKVKAQKPTGAMKTAKAKKGAKTAATRKTKSAPAGRKKTGRTAAKGARKKTVQGKKTTKKKTKRAGGRR